MSTGCALLQPAARRCEGAEHIHVQAPAGAGKTFVALHQMLQVLKEGSGEEHALFVARNPALCVFVAKWMSVRLNKTNSGFGTKRREKLLARIHLLCHPLESGPRSIFMNDGRVTLKVIDNSEELRTSYNLLIVDEVRRMLRNVCVRCFGIFFHLPHLLIFITN